MVEAGFHQRAIRLVCDGIVDAAAIDSQVLAIELRDHPELASQLRVIERLGPSTIQPVVAARQLAMPVKAALRDALLQLGKNHDARRVLAHGDIVCFARVDDARYDDIRGMLAMVEEADFLVFK